MTGRAFPRPIREKVFEPFVRLDEQPPGENGGTGLGLTIARDVVLAHGGDLELDQSQARRPAGRAADAGLSRWPPAEPPVILASSSAARARLLRAAGVAFTRSPALVDEAGVRDSLHAEGVQVEDAAVALAELKAGSVAAARAGRGDRARRRPAARGRRRLAGEAGRPRRRPAPSCCACAAAGIAWSAAWWRSAAAAGSGTTSTSRALWLRPFSDAFLDLSRAAGEAILGCVGAYQLEGLGAQLMAAGRGRLLHRPRACRCCRCCSSCATRACWTA